MRARLCVTDKDIQTLILLMHFGLFINFRVSFIRIAYTLIVRSFDVLIADKDRNISFLSSSRRTQIRIFVIALLQVHYTIMCSNKRTTWFCANWVVVRCLRLCFAYRVHVFGFAAFSGHGRCSRSASKRLKSAYERASSADAGALIAPAKLNAQQKLRYGIIVYWRAAQRLHAATPFGRTTCLPASIRGAMPERTQ